MSLRHFIDKQRLNNVLLKMQKHYPNFTKGELLGAEEGWKKKLFDGEFKHYCPECLEGENCNKVNELRIELNKYQKLLKRIESSPKMPIERWTGDEREIICPACKSYICYPEDIETIDLKYRQFCGACGQKLNWD